MITTTAMSMDRVLVRTREDDQSRIHAAFARLLPGGLSITVKKKTPGDVSGEEREYDYVIEQASPIVKAGERDVAIFEVKKDRRSPAETFSIIL